MFDSNNFYQNTQNSQRQLKMDYNHRNSIDAGYDSILSSTSFLSNSNSTKLAASSHSANLTSDSSLFSQPSTPIKSSNSFIINCNNSTTTPDFKQQYIADVNGIYFASIRQSLANSTAESFPSPNKTSNFSHFSASNSNSPIKLANSPKFVLNTDQYIHERDHIKSKLLRSPAFKINNIISPNCAQYQKPQIKSFNSRFELNYTTLVSPVQERARPNPTEEEFMEMLIRNKHLPSNPEFLIGRHMGIEFLDILTELSKRSMQNVLDQIYGYLNTTDFVRLAGVSRDWRNMVKQNPKINKQRVEFIKLRKKSFETSKENRLGQEPDFVSHKNRLTLEEKRALLKNYRMQHSFDLGLKEGESNHLIKHASGSFVFASLDLNCLNNITSGSASYSDFTQNQIRSRKQARDVEKDEEMCVDEQESPSKRPKTSIGKQMSNELFSACNSLFESINKTQVGVEVKRAGVLEKEFKQISIDEKVLKPVQQPSRISLKTNSENNGAAIQIAQNSPQFIVKNLKVSPSKKVNDSQGNVQQNCKIDLIGSKKSKKNLKRL